MASWSLEKIIGPSISDRNDEFGNYFGITFVLKYNNNALGMGQFLEMPSLEWKETITVLEKNKKEWWTVEFDQYVRCPGSKTFLSCINRYKDAYYSVRTENLGQPLVTKLRNKNGGKISKDTFPRGLERGKAADCARDYLKKNGGILEFTIRDSPAIQRPASPDFHRERFLTFDCGIHGLGTRIIAYQHIIVDGSKPESEWYRECKLGQTPGYKISGLTRVSPPANVVEDKAKSTNTAEGDYL
jgi:hypothetical protein